MQHWKANLKTTKLAELQTENRELKKHGQDQNIALQKMHMYIMNLKADLKKTF